jgi:hypothetical protein
MCTSGYFRFFAVISNIKGGTQHAGPTDMDSLCFVPRTIKASLNTAVHLDHKYFQKPEDIILRPSSRRTKDLLKLIRHQLRWVVGLFTGQCHLKGYLFKLGLIDDSSCEQCLEKDESATQILCDCEAIAYLRFRHLDQFL